MASDLFPIYSAYHQVLPIIIGDLVHFSPKAPKKRNQSFNTSLFGNPFFYFPANGHICSLTSLWPYF